MSNYGVLEESGEEITDIKPKSEPCDTLSLHLNKHKPLHCEMKVGWQTASTLTTEGETYS